MSVLGRLQAASQGDNHKWWAFGAVSIGVFMSTLDTSIANIALSHVMANLDTGLSEVEWVVLAYLLSIGSLLLAFGRLADIVGRKRVYVAGFTVFTLGNLLGGLSPNVLALALARGLTGAGGAMIQANGAAITAAVFPREELGKALGTNSTIVSLGYVAGPTIGGIITDALGWRWVLFIAIPVGLTGVLFASAVLQEARIPVSEGRGEGFDWLGSAAWAGTILTLVLALDRAPAIGWGSWTTVGLFATAIVLGSSFMVIELKGHSPTLDLRLFRAWGFSAGSTATFATFIASQANNFLTPFYLQIGHGFSARTAGLLMTPTFAALAVVAAPSGRLSDRYGSRVIATVGLAFVAAGLLLLSRVTTDDASYRVIIGSLVVLGAGLGMFQAPNNSFIFGSVPRARYGTTSGFLATVRTVGTSLGIATWGAVVSSTLAAAGFAADLAPAAPGSELARQVLTTFLNGYHYALLAAVGVVLFGIAASAARGDRPTPHRATGR